MIQNKNWKTPGVVKIAIQICFQQTRLKTVHVGEPRTADEKQNKFILIQLSILKVPHKIRLKLGQVELRSSNSLKVCFSTATLPP